MHDEWKWDERLSQWGSGATEDEKRKNQKGCEKGEGGGGEQRGMPGILLLRESSLAPSLLSPSLFPTDSHTHRRIHTHWNAKKQSRHVYEDAFNASSFFPLMWSVTAIVQGGNERPATLVWLSPAVLWLSAKPVIINGCKFY